MNKKSIASILAPVALLFVCLSYGNNSVADWDSFWKSAKKAVSGSSDKGVSEKDISRALKDALRIGAQKSVNSLGRQDGFYKDAAVKIPVPDELEKVTNILNKIGQKKLVNRFTKTMNRAAERATKSTFNIFADAIKTMTIQDAVKIYSGRDDEATRYFRTKKQSQLHDTIRPIVKDATHATGVTSNYKKLTNKAGKIDRSLTQHFPDIDDYVTQKTIDGLFHKIAVEEAKIRKDPVARTTDILKKVFGKNDGKQ